MADAVTAEITGAGEAVPVVVKLYVVETAVSPLAVVDSAAK
jgi:hypothetical protein